VTSMIRMLRVELMKTQWPLVAGLVVLGPAVAVLLGGAGAGKQGADAWSMQYMFATLRYAWLFLPLLAGVFAALVCRTEHASGGWKQTLTLPVRRPTFYAAKFVLVAGLLAATQVVFGAVFILAGLVARYPGGAPFGTIALSLVSGWVAVLPLAAVALWASSRWASFGAALALNVVLTLPAIFAAQSADIGPWYPWAQPMLAMVPQIAAKAGRTMLNVSPTTLWVVIGGGLAIALCGGLLTFARSDVRG